MPRTHEGEGDAPAKVEAPVVAMVDDDALVLRSTLRLLRSFGLDAHGFGSAEALLDSNAAARAACLILDVRMPGMDGLALQRTLAERGIRTPVVFLTACASEAEERQARAAGAVALLRKPVEVGTLAQTLRSIVGRPTSS